MSPHRCRRVGRRMLFAALALALGLGLWRARRAPWRPLRSATAGSEAIGTEHPYWLLDADRRERWVALCQARRDTDGDGVVASFFAPHGGVFHDQPRPYLVVGHGPGDELEAYLGADPSGRFVAVARSGEWVLLDVDERREMPLREAGDDDQFRLGLDEQVAASGDTLVAVDGRPGRAAVRRVRLPSGESSTIDLGPGRTASVRIDTTGRWVRALVAVEDTDGDGKIVPSPEAFRAVSGACVGPGRFAWEPSPPGDRQEERWYDLREGRLRERPGEALEWASHAHRDDPALRSPSGAGRELAPEQTAGWRRRQVEAELHGPHGNGSAVGRVPVGPLRWQLPAPAPEKRVARTTERQGDCAVYVPITERAASDDLSPADRGEVNQGALVVVPGRDPWATIGRSVVELTAVQGSQPVIVRVTSPLAQGPVPAATRVALEARTRGRRYEATIDQLADEFAAQAGDEPVTGGWPAWRGYVGFLNSVARAEGAPRRFVLSSVARNVMLVRELEPEQVCGYGGE